MVVLETGSTAARERALRGLDKLPPLAPTLNQLLATLTQEGVSFARVSDVIEKDAMLSGNVLALVNSALYGRQDRVNSIRRAVSLLGLNKLRNAALSMSITRMWSQVRMPSGWSMTRFNQHAIATAILTDLLGQETKVHYVEGGFVAGMLHDIGKILIAMGLPDEYRAIDSLVRSGSPPLEAEMEVLGFQHAAISAEALRRWNLPVPIQTAVAFHHDPDSDPTQCEKSEIALSYLIRAANHYVNACGYSISGETSAVDQSVFAPLSIDVKIPALLENFQREFETVKAFF